MESSTTIRFGCLLANQMAECQPKKEPPASAGGKMKKEGTLIPLETHCRSLGDTAREKCSAAAFVDRFSVDLKPILLCHRV